MEIIVAEPKAVASWQFPATEEIRVMPIGDIQYGAAGCDIDLLQRKLDWAMEHSFYFIGMGDMVDVASPSNRRRWKQAAAELYDSVRDAMDEICETHLERVTKILAPTKGRWLGMVTGHHVWEFQDGTNTDTRLANALGTKYMGDGAAVTIVQFKHPSGPRTAEAKIWYHHGPARVATFNAALNRIQNHIASRFYADVYLMGHITQLGSYKIPFINYQASSKGNVVWQERTRVIAMTGGFMKGYELGTKNPFGIPAAGYVEKGMMAPTSLGAIQLYIRPRLKSGYMSVDIDVLT